MLRAGPFSDERVVGLINRRFVPIAFDLMQSHLSDPAAKEYVVKLLPRLGGAMVSNEPLIIAHARDGELVDKTDNYGQPTKLLRMLKAALKDCPECNRMPDGERLQKDPMLKAEILLDLRDRKGALKALESLDSDASHLLRVRIAREQGDWASMRKSLAKLNPKAHAADLRLERAYLLWYEKKYAELAKTLADFPKDHRRWVEARYFEGLAHYHQKNKKKALELWKEAVQKGGEGPWAYRTDWAYVNVKEGPPKMGRLGATSRTVTSDSPTHSLLGRIHYMGGRNPDLLGPGHW